MPSTSVSNLQISNPETRNSLENKDEDKIKKDDKNSFDSKSSINSSKDKGKGTSKLPNPHLSSLSRPSSPSTPASNPQISKTERSNSDARLKNKDEQKSKEDDIADNVETNSGQMNNSGKNHIVNFSSAFKPNFCKVFEMKKSMKS